MIKLPNTRKGKPFPSCGLGLDSAFCQTWEPCSLLMSHFRIALDCLEPSRVGTKKVPGNMCCDLVENPKNIKPTWVGTNEKGLQILQEQVGCWWCGQRQVAKNWQGVPRMLAGWRVQLMLVTKLRLEWTSGKVLTSLRTKKVKSWTCEKCGKVLVFHSFTSLLFSDIYVCFTLAGWKLSKYRLLHAFVIWMEKARVNNNRFKWAATGSQIEKIVLHRALVQNGPANAPNLLPTTPLLNFCQRSCRLRHFQHTHTICLGKSGLSNILPFNKTK